jgi:hypothetical protein
LRVTATEQFALCSKNLKLTGVEVIATERKRLGSIARSAELGEWYSGPRRRR